MKSILKITFLIVIVLVIAGCTNNNSNNSGDVEVVDVVEEINSNTSDNTITSELALEGVNNYCKETYNYSPDSSSMLLTSGMETDSEYEVIFRSYTGAYVYFYVDKTTGTTRMVETVPDLDVVEETVTINLYDYLNK